MNGYDFYLTFSDPGEIGFAFHWAGISLGRQDQQDFQDIFLFLRERKM
jgi:hypothetical protein